MLSHLITGKYQIITFDEYILIALYADRVVGIYPELKNPIFINEHVSDLIETCTFCWSTQRRGAKLEIRRTCFLFAWRLCQI